MADIVLTTFNARYIHASFGLRYLLANLGPLRSRAALVEAVVGTRPADLAEQLLALAPRIVGVSVAIWNARESAELVAVLKRVRPELLVVVGGPEVSHEWEHNPACAGADVVVTGDGDWVFGQLCHDALEGRLALSTPGPTVVHGGQLPLRDLALPYDEYTDHDLAHRVVYVEASRGCPYRCAFCLSALDTGVRKGELDALLAAFDRLLARGLRQFKFVDRTFNLEPRTSGAILLFFLDRMNTHGPLFLHFEMVPDRLPDALRALLRRFPPGSLQLEIGVQSLEPAVMAAVERVQDLARTEDNLRFLAHETHAHLHVDLIAGLPGETLESFARGFDHLVRLAPHEVQVGILKRLRGMPLAARAEALGLVFAPEPPYEILATPTLDFAALQRLRRFSQVWDLVKNSGHFPETLRLIAPPEASPFERFYALSAWLHARLGRTHAVALGPLCEALHAYGVEALGLDAQALGDALATDYGRGGRGLTPFLRRFTQRVQASDARGAAPARQARHGSA